MGTGGSLTNSLDPGGCRRNALSSVVACQIRTPPSCHPRWLPEEVVDSIEGTTLQVVTWLLSTGRLPSQPPAKRPGRGRGVSNVTTLRG
ncbi:hypothetical protein SBA1_1630002 [Candidatus Sulfotelmatobacter kueseliae]|uniref:Uncharacterized protein n=1 Tax=Candidatus Sulfotelmatobacter kueseliae TaxID=2042962 RepID=A0A2U3KAR6_9BACT|nr:hypothetical protein SBA1_1630002 [Candidatus Sulfotelmatobacter kueseliae]